MADEMQAGGPDEPESGNGEDGRPSTLNVLAQYIKDLSFECPSSPAILQKPATNPRLDVSVNVHAAGIGPEIYEVTLSIQAHAKADEGVVYETELVYGGVFRLPPMPAEHLQAALFVDCAALLFPFARRLIGDLTRDGGFPPLMLDPIDFALLYQRNLARAQAEAQQAPKN